MQPYVDFFNFMAYNIHSPYDSTGQMWSATNLTDVDSLMDSLWFSGVSPSKFNLGTAYYGRVYTASSTSCMDPGCAVSLAGVQGACSKNAGVLWNAEIGSIIKKYNPLVSVDTGKTLEELSYYARC